MIPRWMRWALDENTAFRFVDIGVNVFGMDKNIPPLEMGEMVIEKFEELFFDVLKLPRTFKDLGLPEEALDVMVDHLDGIVAERIQKLLFKPMKREDVREILSNCYK